MSSSRRSCRNDPDKFCYICGEYIFKDQRKAITDFVRKVYLSYFKVKLGDQDKPWAPHIVCKACVESLRKWTKDLKGFNRRKKNTWNYPNLESARRPVPQLEEVPVPKFSDLPDTSLENDEFHEKVESSASDSSGSVFESRPLILEPFKQEELSDLIRDLNLSKEAAEILASRLKDKNCLGSGASITFYHTREKELRPYFSQQDELVYCKDIEGLLLKMGVPQYRPQEWRLFKDSSKRSLKCVLLHNGNSYASLPIGHSTKLKEEYNNIKTVLQKLDYDSHQWLICVDLKMVNFLLGQQSGYTKYPCFICLWDSRARTDHWVKKGWPPRDSMRVGEGNIINEPLVARKKIIIPPLHIKLGLMKQFVKALPATGDCFNYICRTFPALTIEKLKAGIFDGPQIRKLIKDVCFVQSMTDTESAAWQSFVLVTQNFLGNRKAENYQELVEDMLSKLKDLGVKMSIKVHYLFSHLDRFPANLGDLSEE
ncbi:uncharacterized protein LOC143444861 [Clavelina lepadiformis]|uniref:uncharacterized protein LOC143444861 n=1 Tax=Clavelina lepadiformis TaxID=159417 RepID=UPI0040415065